MLAPGDVTVADLLEPWGAAGLDLLAGPVEAVLRSATCTVHDPAEPMPVDAAGVLLGVGLTAVDAPAAVRAAGSGGFDAVVVRRGCASSDLTTAADDAGLAVLGCESDMPWLQVERIVSSVLAGTARSGHASGGSDLFGFANAVASVVGGAVVIEDPNRRVLGYSTLAGQEIDDLRRASILGREAGSAESDARYAAVLASGAALRVPGGDGVLDRLAVAIRLGVEVLGTMWVIDGGGITDDGPPMLERASELAAVQILRARTAAEFEAERTSALVGAVIAGGTEVRPAVQRLGLHPHGPFSVLVFAGDLRDGTAPASSGPEITQMRWARFHTMMRGYAAGWIPAVGVHADAGSVYVLLHGPEAADAARVASNADVMVERAADWGLVLRAGIGSPVANPDQIHDSRVEADALAQVPDAERSGPVMSAERDHSALALWWLRRAIGDRPGVGSPYVARLMEHDERHGSDLVKTWSVWFANAMDTGRTATALSVHPNTLRYRLKRAAEISGLGVSADDHLIAWLTLRLGGR